MSDVVRAMEIAANPESMTNEEALYLLQKALAEVEQAQRRQADPDEYQLLLTEGMPWKDVVSEISGDAVLVAFIDEECG